MTDLDIANMPLPINKPIEEWDELDHLIAETRAGEIAAALSPAPRRTRNCYHRPDGKLFPVPLVENEYYH